MLWDRECRGRNDQLLALVSHKGLGLPVEKTPNNNNSSGQQQSELPKPVNMDQGHILFQPDVADDVARRRMAAIVDQGVDSLNGLDFTGRKRHLQHSFNDIGCVQHKVALVFGLHASGVQHKDTVIVF